MHQLTMNARYHNATRFGHSLLELVVAMVASAFLLAGLGAVMMIGRQVAYTPTAAAQRIEAADVVSQIAEELRYATLVIQQTPRILEFVVADRDADGTAEKIRYEWSSTAGDPLYKSVNAGTAVIILNTVTDFTYSLQLNAQTTTLKSTIESAETLLLANTNVQNQVERDVTATDYHAQLINTGYFPAVPADAIAWNATKFEFFGLRSGSASEMLLVQLRSTGEPNDAPTSSIVGQVSIPEIQMASDASWNTAEFPATTRGLALHRKYALAFVGVGGGPAAKLVTNELSSSGMYESTDAGASWQAQATRQMYGRLYGTYTRPGPTYSVTRNYVSHVRLVLQGSDKSHARVDASVPLVNSPELTSAYWRADFDRNPTATNANGDGVADWILAGGGSFDITKLIGGIWYATGALESRPLSDFTTTTTVEVRCRNSSVGGNGAVVQINADRSGGLYAPLSVYVQRQADGSQTLTLSGKSSDAATVTLCSRQNLSADFIRYRLTILPENNVVNLQINDEDHSSYTYPTYAPSSVSDRFVTLYADGSSAEFDYVDVRVATQ